MFNKDKKVCFEARSGMGYVRVKQGFGDVFMLKAKTPHDVLPKEIQSDAFAKWVISWRRNVKQITETQFAIPDGS